MHTAASLECAFALRLRAPLPRASKAQRDAALPFCEVCCVCLPKLGSKLPRHTRWNSVRRRKSKVSKQAKKKPPSESGAASPLCTPPRIGTGSCSCLTWSSPCVCGWYHGICGICGSGIGCETVSWIVCVCGSWDSRSVYPVLACSSRECAVCACPGPPAPAGVFEPRNCSGSLLSSVQFSYFTVPPRAYVAAVACACC